MKFPTLALAALAACSSAVAVPLEPRQSSYTDYLMVYVRGGQFLSLSRPLTS
jgi:hypothetical protein